MDEAEHEKRMKELSRHYFKSVKKGVVLSTKSLLEYSRQKKWSYNLKEIQKIKRRFPKLAAFERTRDRPPAYVKNLFPRYGQLMIDLAFYREKWKRSNQGYIGRPILFCSVLSY